jgi:hypothetical protein
VDEPVLRLQRRAILADEIGRIVRQRSAATINRDWRSFTFAAAVCREFQQPIAAWAGCTAGKITAAQNKAALETRLCIVPTPTFYRAASRSGRERSFHFMVIKWLTQRNECGGACAVQAVP